MKLKPCPFCKSQDLNECRCYKDLYSGMPDLTILHAVECLDCGAKITRGTKEEAAKAWNRRPK